MADHGHGRSRHHDTAASRGVMMSRAGQGVTRRRRAVWGVTFAVTQGTPRQDDREAGSGQGSRGGS